eukprot:CAMPEP_0118950560 /NCGR_PEP_ID=MMETSP1169-20130426/51615_1 /TAXON_ID=36882 /ORGANISM="Pyramimonas obovata, Strain CCMP722" /LENGTH=66 /DNA_ID=CAMNT_0006897433 /DNA_START=56 /DNA_END=257 /DNA_ORIENTATION=-
MMTVASLSNPKQPSNAERSAVGDRDTQGNNTWCKDDATAAGYTAARTHRTRDDGGCYTSRGESACA